ncbi:hypothetical protein ACROYT_G014234 [Oculina patagonica]
MIQYSSTDSKSDEGQVLVSPEGDPPPFEILECYCGNEVDGKQTKKPRESVLGESQKTSYTLESELERAVNSCINYCLEKNIENPVEILRCSQRFVLCGRPLDVSDPSATLEGETKFILVNRENVFQSAKKELESVSEITNPQERLL